MSLPAPPPSGPSGGLFQQIVADIPGGQQLMDLLNLVGAVIPAMSAAISQGIGDHPLDTLVKFVKHLDKLAALGDMDLSKIYSGIADISVGSFFREYLLLGLGVDPDKFSPDSSRAADVVDRMIGFAFILQFTCAAIGGIGKALLSDRWGEAFSEALSEIPSEMGLSWAMGMTVEKGFEAALGNVLEEDILAQKQTRAPEWPVIRTMLKQHLISTADLDDRLKAQGFNDHWRTAVSALADQLLPVGDLQAAYMHELIPESEVRAGLEALGFATVARKGQSQSDVDTLMQLYIDKAETASSRMLTSTAHSLFARQLITEDVYRGILTAANFPAREIDNDIAAVNLELQNGRLQTSASTIKSQLLHHVIDQAGAITQLVHLGYVRADAVTLTQTWLLPPLQRLHGLSQAKILSYLISGLLSPTAARTQLLATGLHPEDVDFLLQHPQASNGVRVHALTPALVTSAYLDGAITQSDLVFLYGKAGVDPQYVPYYTQIADFKKSRLHYTGPGTLALSEAHIIAAYKYGLFDQHTAQDHLTNLGYSAENALLLIEIENKGPIQPAQPPAFASLQAAEDYLTTHGYTLTGPPDPLLIAAENMVAQAGITYTLTQPQQAPMP